MRLTTNLDDTLIALADPTRRAILQRLSQGDAGVALPLLMAQDA